FVDRCEDGARSFFQAGLQTIAGELFEVGFARVTVRCLVLRQVRFIERQLEVALISDPTSVADRTRKFREGRRDLVRGFYIQLVGIEFHASRIAESLAGL